MTNPNTNRVPRNTVRLKAEDRRQQILEVAKIIICSEGMEKFTSRAVAERSGIRLATLQYYFPTKDDLFRAAFKAAVETESERIDRVIDAEEADTLDETIRLRILAHVRAGTHEDTAGMFVQLWASASTNPIAKELMQAFYDEEVNLLSQLLHEYRPQLSKREAISRSIMIFSFLEGMTLFHDRLATNISNTDEVEHQVVTAAMALMDSSLET